MNRTEFMSQLEMLLRNVSDGEREEALQYYNDYFDDAGAENEQSVIEALGNPARVAENIRRELLESQRGKSSTAADRAVVEYGKAQSDGKPEADGQAGVPAAAEARDNANTAGQSHGTGYFDVLKADQRAGAGNGQGASGWSSSDGGSAEGGKGTYGGFASVGGNGGAGGGSYTDGWSSGGAGGTGGGNGAQGRSGRSGGMTAALVVLAIFASPFILGLVCVVFGLLMVWLGLVLGFGITALCLFLVLFILLVVGGMCIAVDPLVGFGVMGGGLICGGVGLLFLMLTVAMAGAVPAIAGGISRLFHFGRKKAKMCG